MSSTEISYDVFAIMEKNCLHLVNAFRKSGLLSKEEEIKSGFSQQLSLNYLQWRSFKSPCTKPLVEGDQTLECFPSLKEKNLGKEAVSMPHAGLF